MDFDPDHLHQAWKAFDTFNENHPWALNATRRVASWLGPTVLRWTAPARHHCIATLCTDVASAQSWSSLRQVAVTLLLTFMTGPLVFLAYSQATGNVPPFVEAWTVAVASATSAYGLWIITRSVWRLAYWTGAKLAI